MGEGGDGMGWDEMRSDLFKLVCWRGDANATANANSLSSLEIGRISFGPLVSSRRLMSFLVRDAV